MFLGDINMNKGRYWLEIIFPDGPPQEYEVSGIEITDEFVAWSVKTYTQQEYARLVRTLFPTAAITASWASIRYQFNMQANKVRAYLGLPPKVDLEAAHMRAFLKPRPNTKHFGGDSKPPEVPPNPLAKGFPPPPPAISNPSPSKDAGTDEPASSGPPHLPSLPGIVPRGEEKPVTLALFLHNFRKNRKKTSIEPPRGSIFVTGLIEIIGSKGRVSLDVGAAFDPPSDEFVSWSWKPRRIQPKAQRPKGGF